MTMTLDSDEEEVFIRLHAVEEKWKLIFQQEPRAPLLPVKYYVEHIKKCLAQKAEKQNEITLPQEKSALCQLLKKLKMDLKMAYSWFLSEFASEPYLGVSMLVDVLKEAQNELNNNKAITLSKKHDQQKRTLIEEYDSLLCLKFATVHLDGLQKLVKHPNGLTAVASALVSSFSKSRIVSLELLTRALDVVGGYENVLQAMIQLRLRLSESVRFKFLISMLNNQGTAFINFQAICMTFINRLLSCAISMNQKVYLQTELEEAGVDIDALEKISNGDSKDHLQLQDEIRIYRKNYIDVKELQNKIQELHNTTDKLKEEVKFLRENVQRLTDDKMNLMRIEKEPRYVYFRMHRKIPSLHRRRSFTIHCGLFFVDHFQFSTKLSDQVVELQQQLDGQKKMITNEEPDDLKNEITFGPDCEESKEDVSQQAVQEKIHRFENLKYVSHSQKYTPMLPGDRTVDSPNLKYYFGTENNLRDLKEVAKDTIENSKNSLKISHNFVQLPTKTGFLRGTKRLDSDSGHSTHSTDSTVVSSDSESIEKDIVYDSRIASPRKGKLKLNGSSYRDIKLTRIEDSKPKNDSGFSSPLATYKPKRTLSDNSNDSFESSYNFNFILRKQPFTRTERLDNYNKFQGTNSSLSFDSPSDDDWSLYHPTSLIKPVTNGSSLYKCPHALLDRQIEEALKSIDTVCEQAA